MFGYLLWAPRIPGVPWLAFKALRAMPFLLRLPWGYGGLTYRRLDPELLRSWIEPAAEHPEIRRDIQAILRGAGPAVTLGAAERLKDFPGPTLLLWSKDDRFFPLSLAHRLAGALADAQVEVLDRAGLLVPLDQPERVAEGIARFHAHRVAAAHDATDSRRR